MVGELEHDPTRMRISDADRHQVSEILRTAAAEGRLELEELDERLEATYAARTYADLVPITSDLPVGGPAPAVPMPTSRSAAIPPVTRYDSSFAVMSGVDRKGVWEVGPTHTAFSLMGSVTIDLREAVLTGSEVVITATTLMGGVDVVVNQHMKVVVEGVGIMGDFSQGRDKVEPQLSVDSPVVRVRGAAIMGAVSVVRKAPKPPKQPRRLRGGS